MPGERVFEAVQGPIRATIIANGPALALFSAKARNSIIRTALQHGGRYWLRTFLPKRFSDYAYRIGYNDSHSWAKAKQFLLGKSIPFIGFTPPGGGKRDPKRKATNPEKMAVAAINGANVRSTATAKNARIVFTIPYGHPVRPETSAQFRTVPPWEVDRVAKVVAETMQRILGGLLGDNYQDNLPQQAPGRMPAIPRVSARVIGELSTSGGPKRRGAYWLRAPPRSSSTLTPVGWCRRRSAAATRSRIPRRKRPASATK